MKPLLALLAALSAAALLAQVSSSDFSNKKTSPSGQACTVNVSKTIQFNGIVYTCQGGNYAANSTALPTQGGNTITGNKTGAPGAPTGLSAADTRTVLGLGTAALQPSTAFDASGSASAAQAASAQKSANLVDLASAVTARINLGLTTYATMPTVAGDGTLDPSTGLLVVTKVNGGSLPNSALAIATNSSGQPIVATDPVSKSALSVQAIAGPITSPLISNVIQVDGQPDTCVYSAVTYTTKVQCANQAALALMNSISSNIVMEFGSAGLYPTCGSIYLSDSVGRYAISLKGRGRSWQNHLFSATHLQQSCDDPAGVAIPTVYKPAGTVRFLWPYVSISGMEIDPNGHANAAMELFGVTGTGYDNLYDPPIASSDHFVQVGDATNTAEGGAYEWFSDNEKMAADFSGRGARFTPNVVSGAITSYTFISGGGGYSGIPANFHVRFSGYPGCTTLPTLTPIPTYGSGGTAGQVLTLTPAAVNTAGQGAGCTTGTVNLQVYDIYPVTYGYVYNASDSTLTNLTVKDAGSSYAVVVNSGHNHFVHLHPQGSPGGVQVNSGGNTFTHTECDTDSTICVYNNGSHNRFFGTESYYNSAVASSLPGAATFQFGPSSSAPYLFGTNAGADTAGADFHEYLNSSGGIYNPTLASVNDSLVTIGDTGDTTNGAIGGLLNGPLYPSIVKVRPTGIAVSGTNFNSNTFDICASAWSGSAATIPCGRIQLSLSAGTGSSIAQFFKISSVSTTGGSFLFQVGSLWQVNSVTGATNLPSLSGSGTATFAAQAGAGTGATAVCATSHVCDSLSGEVILTSGSVGTPSTGSQLIITLPVTRTNQPNCTVEAYGGTTFLGITKSQTTSTITISAGVALTFATAYTINYVCGGN